MPAFLAGAAYLSISAASAVDAVTGALRQAVRSFTRRSDAFLERDARVRELVEARPCARGDEFARRHLLLRTVDTVERDQLAAAQIAGAEAVRCGIAAHDHSVMPVGYPDDDEFQVVLIRPEPRHLVVDGCSSEQIECRARALLERVVDRLEPQAPSVMQAGMIGAVPGCVTRRVRGAAALVHHDPVRALDLRSDRQLVDRRYAHADDHDIRRMLRAILREHRAHPAGLGVARERAHSRIAENAYSV